MSRNGTIATRATNPMAAVTSTVNSVIRPNWAPVILELTSRLKAKHGVSALNTTRERVVTLAPRKRARRNPTPATMKIGRISEAKMEKKTGRRTLTVARNRARS
jgi:hypothetical protein